jgi:hypothetical protein
MSENENDFEALRRLLALKRHEIPPPGYFENFSSQVIGRIRANERVAELPWLLRFLQAFEARPAYPVAFASSLCMLLLFGIVSVQQTPGFSSVAVSSGQQNGTFSSVTPSAMSDVNSQMIADVATNPPANLPPNTSTSVFNPQPNPYFQQTSYSISGN